MKVILVTGSTRGIGKETVRQLARLGHHTILTGRNPQHVTDATERDQRPHAVALVRRTAQEIMRLPLPRLAQIQQRRGRGWTTT